MPLIIDTDMSFDVDDVLAVCIYAYTYIYMYIYIHIGSRASDH